MPKDYITNMYFGQYGNSIPDDPNAKPVPVALDASAVKVAWSREPGHVEIAVIADFGPEGRDGGGDWHSQLDRNGINRLIRTLRRARDAAFGSDA